MIMTSFKDGTAEGVIGGNVDATFVSEDSSFNLPVGKVGAEGEGNILMHRLKHLYIEQGDHQLKPIQYVGREWCQ